MAKDPVCGMEVNPSESKHKTNFQGQDYNFCSSECKDKFTQNPKQYAGQGQHTGQQQWSGQGQQRPQPSQQGGQHKEQGGKEKKYGT